MKTMMRSDGMRVAAGSCNWLCARVRLLSTVVYCAIVLVVGHSSSSAQETKEEDAAAKRHFELFLKSAADLKIKPVGENDFLRLQEVPLQKFTATEQIYGSVFAWTDSDRRLALVGTIGSLPIGGEETEFVELHLIKPEAIEPVVISGFPNKTWTPDVELLKPNLLKSDPKIGKTPASRLIEMRSLIRDFRAEQHHEGQVHLLRLLPQPLYRMTDSSAEQDEALFAFVGETGTDPEVLVRIVLLEHESVPKWHYQALRFNWREQVLFHKETQVWRVEEFLTRNAQSQSTPYLTGLTKSLKQSL